MSKSRVINEDVVQLAAQLWCEASGLSPDDCSTQMASLEIDAPLRWLTWKEVSAFRIRRQLMIEACVQQAEWGLTAERYK